MSSYEVATVRLRILTDWDFGCITSPSCSIAGFSMLLTPCPCSQMNGVDALSSFCSE